MSGNMRNERLEQIFADHKIMGNTLHLFKHPIETCILIDLIKSPGLGPSLPLSQTKCWARSPPTRRCPVCPWPRRELPRACKYNLTLDGNPNHQCPFGNKTCHFSCQCTWFGHRLPTGNGEYAALASAAHSADYSISCGHPVAEPGIYLSSIIQNLLQRKPQMANCR